MRTAIGLLIYYWLHAGAILKNAISAISHTMTRDFQSPKKLAHGLALNVSSGGALKITRPKQHR